MVELEGAMVVDAVPALSKRLAAISGPGEKVELDLSAVTDIDSSGVALLSLFLRRMEASGRDVALVRVPERVKRTLELFPFVDARVQEAEDRGSIFDRVGRWAEGIVNLVLHFLVVVADTTWFVATGVFKKRGVRWHVVIYEMAQMGSKALAVVALIAFLVGATMALQSAAQLRQFGADIFVVDLIGISMTRELGPLMAAIVVAGRSGSAVAAEIGTMMISEEIDALKTMGLHPTRFLVVPKILAITVTQPLLTAFADAAGVFGGFLVATFYLDVGAQPFIVRLQESLYLKDVLTGLIKSVMFAWLIVSVGAICGFRTKGGADAVGRSTTTSVVAGIFAVIVADALASLVFYFGD
ncbi:MAG: MlaE family lipid ABC transporter permease subunit [Deltaproteobacteria bacterium]|jgi:phospholipid/cholesterol/gamma-HCH transport system permease protein